MEYFYDKILFPNMVGEMNGGIGEYDIRHCNKILGININEHQNGKQFYLDMFLKNYKSYLVDMEQKVEYCQMRMKEDHQKRMENSNG